MSVRGTKVNSRILVLLLVPSVLLMAALTLILRGWVRDVILTPILFLLWLGGLLIRSTPQWLFWGVFLVLALLILANSLGMGKGPDQNVDRAEPGYPQRERVLFWAKHIRWMARRDFPLLGNGEPLRRLILEVVAFQERLSLTEVEQRLESGELDVPPPIQTCLQHKLTSELSPPASLWERLQHRWADFRRRAHVLISGLTQTRSDIQPSPFDSELESIAQFLEDRLRIIHDE